MADLEYHENPDTGNETFALDPYNTVGITTAEPIECSNTRYAEFDVTRLRKIMEHAEEAHGEGASVVVGVGPDRPILVKGDRDSTLALSVAPRIDPGDDDDE